MPIKPHSHVLQRMSEIVQGDLYVDSFLALATKSHDPNLPAITRAHQDYIDACLSAAEAIFNIEKARAEFIRSLETPSPAELPSTSTVTGSNPNLILLSTTRLPFLTKQPDGFNKGGFD